MTDNIPLRFSAWCKTAGLGPWSVSRGFPVTNWRGHGRHWRINDKGEFQMSERFKTFDRWANSLDASCPPDLLPQNARQLRGMVEYMLGGGFGVFKP
jgi:hypothetical protein